LSDFHKAINLLDCEEDFQGSDLEEDDHGQPIKIYYDWLERGKSSGENKKIKPGGGLTFESSFTSGPGMESYRILGSIKLEPGRLEMTAQGKERLAIEKQRLENVLSKTLIALAPKR
jgi:hypothetical protein